MAMEYLFGWVSLKAIGQKQPHQLRNYTFYQNDKTLMKSCLSKRNVLMKINDNWIFMEKKNHWMWLHYNIAMKWLFSKIRETINKIYSIFKPIIRETETFRVPMHGIHAIKCIILWWINNFAVLKMVSWLHF